IAGADVAVVIGTGIPGTPVDQVQLRIVRSRHPCGASAMLLEIAAPCFGTGLAASGDGPESPNSLAGLCVVSVKESANASLGAGNSDDDFVLDGQRRGGGGVIQPGIGDVLLPEQS